MSNNTADFLVELGTEELPPTALKKLSNAFASGITSGLQQARLTFDSNIEIFATPRRLAVLVPALALKQADQQIEKLGPAVKAAYDKEGSPSKAALGFARSNNVDFDQLETVDTDKGERLCYKAVEPGQDTAALLPEIVSQSLTSLPIPKRMRWGASRAEFVRPAHWLVMLLDKQIVNAELLGLSASNQSAGHRFHCNQPIEITCASDYENLLTEQGHIVPCFTRRRALIEEQVNQIAASLNGNAVIESELLDEVTALVEYPVAVAGSFDKAFLDVPKEALISSMSEHQKYFHVVDANGNLLPHFITVSNIKSDDYSSIIDGNERVIRPRLADAAFFFETDKKHSLTALRARLKNVVFQQQLGTVFDKTVRVGSLAATIAQSIGADANQAKQAGELCKADLASDMVLEFDKMQGLAGGYYASHEGLGNNIATAISEHYLPRYAGDKVPSIAEACAVAIADRLDTITGIFGIGQEPSGSKDPFALRRASIGVLQIILQNRLVLDLRHLVEQAVNQHEAIADKAATVEKVCGYIFDRFTAFYQEQGIATEIILAVRAVASFDALDFNARIHAVQEFAQQPESEALAGANKRVSNILNKSETANAKAGFKVSLLTEAAEKTLATEIENLQKQLKPLLESGNYRESLLALTTLKGPIDAFFDSVMVNAEDAALKTNRLALLGELRRLFTHVADIALLAPVKK